MICHRHAPPKCLHKTVGVLTRKQINKDKTMQTYHRSVNLWQDRVDITSPYTLDLGT